MVRLLGPPPLKCMHWVLQQASALPVWKPTSQNSQRLARGVAFVSSIGGPQNSCTRPLCNSCRWPPRRLTVSMNRTTARKRAILPPRLRATTKLEQGPRKGATLLRSSSKYLNVESILLKLEFPFILLKIKVWKSIHHAPDSPILWASKPINGLSSNLEVWRIRNSQTHQCQYFSERLCRQMAKVIEVSSQIRRT